MRHETIILWVGWTLFGAIVGSFLNAFIHRWPRRISLVTRARSFCPACENEIAWYDNVPILSYLVLLGRCRRCRERIPARYLLVELLSTGLFALAYYQGIVAGRAPLELSGWRFVVVASFIAADLIALSFVDIETYTVPVVTTTSLIVLGFVLAPLWPALHTGSATRWTGVVWLGERRLDALIDSLQGAILAGGLVWATGAAAELTVKKEAMGGGDVKLLAGVGALLGWKAGVATFFIAPFIGTAVGVPILAWDSLTAARKGEGEGKGPKEPETEKETGPAAGKDEESASTGKDSARGITYRYEPDEEPPPTDEEVVKSYRLLVFGFVIASVEALALLLPGPRKSIAVSAPLYFGSAIGFFMCFYDVVRRRLVREGRWIERDFKKAEDGSTEERLTGHYLPFGPFLAVSALVVVFFGREVLAWAARTFFPVV
ncbi:MAG: prepilin peptidase [Planctomycetota bacterium]